MAKDPGLNFKTEEDFQKSMGPSMNPKSLQQVVQQLRTNNLSAKSISADNISVKALAEPVIKDSKEVEAKQKEIKGSEKLLESHKKLTTNIEKLTKTISDSVLGKNKAKADRAEDIAGKQKLDYRGIGQQFKEKIMGRGGDKWDTNSLRYKLGSLRGLARTTGLVKEGGFFDNKMAVREERLRTATRMSEANSTMTNLGPKGNKTFGSKGAVEQYYQRRGKDVIKARAGLQSEEYNRDKYREAGISDEEYERTTGGRQQVKKLAEAGQAVIDVDPRLQGEKKGAIKFAGPDDDKLNVSEEEESQLRAIESASQPMEELINITKVEIERKTKADMDLLEAVKGIESGGGGALGAVADVASNMVGGKGGGKLGKLAKFASKNSKMLKIGGGVLAGGIAAYEGYSDYKDADEQVKSGAITEDQGDIKKTGAVGGAAGGLGGALGGAALGTMIMPGVGTVIGGAIGGLAGSKVGKGIGEWGSKTWKGLTGKGDDSKPQVKSTTTKESGEYNLRMDPDTGKFMANDKEISGEEYTRLQNMPLGMDKVRAVAAAANNADRVAAQSSDNAIAKTPNNAAPSNNIVNAPTTISKQTQNTAVNVPIRDQDHSIRKYYNSRFAS
jgi:hypothetical protein